MPANDPYQEELYKIFSRFRIPREDATYPPYHSGQYLEEYFIDKFYLEKPTSTRYFLPITWTAVFNYRTNEGLGPGTPNHNLRQELMQSIGDLAPDKSYFTVSTHDDAPQGSFPKNILHFLAGGNSTPFPFAPIPLIASGFKKYNDTQKMIFCSFVGSITHPIRNTLLQSLVNNPGYFIKGYDWQPEIPEDRSKEFKDNELVADESKIIDQSNFDNENNMKVSHGKKQHVILKII